MNIYTITLNPAYDVHAHTDRFAPFHENLAQILSKEAGGKGLNISRALKNAGISHKTVIVLGTENSADYRKQLDALGLDCLLLEKEGRIRENLTLHCANAPETRISFSGFQLDNDILSQVEAAIEKGEETIVTFTGRNPEGVSLDAVKAFLITLRQQGVKIVLDSRSFSLQDMYDVQPWLIKPNQEEISDFFHCCVDTLEDATEKALEIAKHGIPNVMISLGSQGGLLVSKNRVFHAMPPVVAAVSTIGAGDSAIAGFLTAAIGKEAPENCLCSAVAFGTAACLTSGSQPPQMQDIGAIQPQVKLTQLI